MKRTFFLLLAILFSIRLVAQDVSALVKKEASLKAMSYLNLIPEGREKSYGFESRSDFSKIKIEEPYQTYYLFNKDGKLEVRNGNEWRVPISVDGKYVSLLTVQMNKGKAEVVDFGGNVLAQKLQEFEKLYLNPLMQRVMIRNTFLNSDFVPLDFSAFCKKNADADFIEIDSNSSQSIYQLAKGEPIKKSVSDFYYETMYVINNTPQYK